MADLRSVCDVLLILQVMLAYLHKCNGSILLVGEGDFSFALSLSKHLPQVSLIATCIEGNAPIKYRHAQHNIDQLKEAGGNVIFGVDATSIESCELLKGRKFGTVIFNFPHTGRKARIQDNRELVRKFFISASQCLTSDGRVMLTLCNGQGGTPADKPQREWFNSWQVISMATYADLILTHTEEFVAEEFQEYNCTGYRGRGNGFNTEGAITHVFERFPATQELAPSPHVLHLGENDRVFTCPEELGAYVERNPLQDSTSPIYEVYHRISERCKFLVNDILIQETKKCDWIAKVNGDSLEEFMYNLKERHTEDACATDGPDENDVQRTDTVRNEDSDSVDGHLIVDSGSMQTVEDPKACKSQDINFVLCPSIKQCSPCQSDQDGRAAKLLVGPVFRQCHIDPKMFPISHELQLFLPEESCKHSMAEIASSLISSISPDIQINFEPLCVGSEMPSVNSKQEGSELLEMDRELNITQQILEKLSELSLDSRKDSPDLGRTRSLSNHHLMQRNIWMDSIRQRCMESASCGTHKEEFHVVTVSSDTSLHEVGLMGKITQANAKSKILIIFNIGLLAMFSFNIDDVRLLWLNNVLLKTTTATDMSSYICYSKHAPCYVRDLSFWVTPAAFFPEIKFFSIVRTMCAGCVKSVDLIDVYKDETRQRYSLCYRFVYQSRTSALSRSKVNMIHEYLGARLESCLAIQLRS